jgi:DNA polymerase subunit Cdc27
VSNTVHTSELASFYASSRCAGTPVHATYLLIGDVAPVKAAGSYRDNDEDEMDKEDDTQESVSTSKIVLVGEDELEGKLTCVFLSLRQPDPVGKLQKHNSRETLPFISIACPLQRSEYVAMLY